MKFSFASHYDDVFSIAFPKGLSGLKKTKVSNQKASKKKATTKSKAKASKSTATPRMAPSANRKTKRVAKRPKVPGSKVPIKR